ncbi:unnamed protein product [Paramecium octaurelia]|uniref:Uncharacterized protein n=1 Tax=Paramecium octaurelia TaxID=43137 RepID=A0A8S1UZW0_PAROT|nr:unnamed protein product [Paramecium octaurelia]
MKQIKQVKKKCGDLIITCDVSDNGYKLDWNTCKYSCPLNFSDANLKMEIMFVCQNMNQQMGSVNIFGIDLRVRKIKKIEVFIKEQPID